MLTSLTKEALPVIRYRTRDLTRLLPGTARTMRRMEKITGRSDDMLIIRGVNVFPSQIEELILKQPGLSPHYVLELSKDGPLDHLTVVVEGERRRTPACSTTSSPTSASAPTCRSARSSAPSARRSASSTSAPSEERSWSPAAAAPSAAAICRRFAARR